MKVVIFCGGRGTRLREETEYRPKPMLPIGDKPILWHIMKTYAHYGHNEFILCLGYKGEIIRDYFRNYLWHICDTTLKLGRQPEVRFHNGHGEESWTVTLAETGLESGTAHRLKMVSQYLDGEENFLLTYGDGLGNVKISEVIDFHLKCGKACTLTAVHPPGRFGELGIEKDGCVNAFNEKPQAEGGLINGGFMVCNRRIFNFLPDDPREMFEREPMKRLTADRELQAFPHLDFWQPMDTFMEFTYLNGLWDAGKAPWKVWE